MAQKVRKPTPKQYDNDLIRQAIAYSPGFRPCRQCGWPQMIGHPCQKCGAHAVDGDPGASYRVTIR